MIVLEDALFVTIAYADVFDYPLTLDEIFFWCVRYPFRAKKKKEYTRVGNMLKNSFFFKERNGFFCLKGRENIVPERYKRMHWSEKKIQIAIRAAGYLRLIPTIRLVGITGTLSMRNVTKDDDIDFFIISSSYTVWTTRLLSTLLFEFLGIRRHPGDTDVNNRLCLNMFIDEESLQIPQKERDLFSAHEVLQMMPLWDRGEEHAHFLRANKWVYRFLPNAGGLKSFQKRNGGNIFRHYPVTPLIILVSFLCRFAEYPFKRLQIYYMRQRRTTEVIHDRIIRFHPHDARVWIYQKLTILSGKKHIPLDNIFYRG